MNDFVFILAALCFIYIAPLLLMAFAYMIGSFFGFIVQGFKDRRKK